MARNAFLEICPWLKSKERPEQVENGGIKVS